MYLYQLTHPEKTNQRGITYVEVLVTLMVIAVLFTVIMVIINPAQIQARGRDEKRLSDMSVLERAISEYVLDVGSYPGVVDTTRYSNVIPAGNTGPLELATSGWIDANMLAYVVKLPLDPINDSTYRYSYRHTVTGFEINAVLEYETTYAQNDGGNDSGVYELGNDLNIL